MTQLPDEAWQDEPEQAWHEEPEERRPMSVYRIETSGGRQNLPCTIQWWTNDDEDSGYVGTEARDEFTYPNLAKALKFTGYTRQGVGSDVEVYLDGELLHQGDRIALIEADDNQLGSFHCQHDTFILGVGPSYTDGHTVIIYEKMPSDLNYGDIDIPDDPFILRRLARMLNMRAELVEAQQNAEGDQDVPGGDASSGDQS